MGVASPVRVGLIGAGGMARQHLSVFRACPGIRAVGITSRTRAKAAALAQEFCIDVVADDLDELVVRARPEALMVLVSEEHARDVGARALSVGVPVFFEKPAGLTPADNRTLADLAAQRRIPTMVGFNRRYYSIFQQGKERIDEHGGLSGIVVEGHERMWRVREGGKFSDAVLENWMFANSVHTIDLLRFFGGDVCDVHAIAQARHGEARGDAFAGVMETTAGAIGVYHAFWYSPGGWSVTLYSNGITVHYRPLEKGWWVDRAFAEHPIEPDAVDVQHKPGLFRQAEALRDFVRSGTRGSAHVDLADSLRTMELAAVLSQDPHVPRRSI